MYLFVKMCSTTLLKSFENFMELLYTKNMLPFKFGEFLTKFRYLILLQLLYGNLGIR
jgi:hypothetical protein